MEWSSGNIYIRPNVLKVKGDSVEGHTHSFDHTTIFFKGSFLVKAKLKNGETIEKNFEAPAHCLIKADVEHEIIAKEDDSIFWCVYSHRTPQGDIVQEFTGWEDSYV